MDFPSVGATQNLMMAAISADGVTKLIKMPRVNHRNYNLALLNEKWEQQTLAKGTETLVMQGVKAMVLNMQLFKTVLKAVAAAMTSEMSLSKMLPGNINCP